MENEKTEKKSGIAGKIDKLQKQYNKILVDLFRENAECCIDEAIEGSTGPIGSNIEEIIQSALDSLKSKVMEELGIAGEVSIDVDIMSGMDDGVGIGGIALEIGDGSSEDEEGESDSEESDTEEFETEESGSTETEDSEDTKTEEEDEDETVDESVSTARYLP